MVHQKVNPMGRRCDILHVRSPSLTDANALASPHSAGLHEGQTGNPASKGIETAIDESGLLVAVHQDVYRALATLCRAAATPEPERSAPRVMVVSLDALRRDEYEFFTIARRVLPNTSIYVYADQDRDSRIADAVRAGAQGIATPGVIKGLADRADEPDGNGTGLAFESDRREELTGGGSTPKKWDKSQGHETEQAASPIDPIPTEVAISQIEDQHQDVADDEPPAPVRVPWRTYDQPTRTSPASRNPVLSASPGEALTHPADVNANEPLLTADELRALIGEDLATVADDTTNDSTTTPREDAQAGDDNS